MCRFLLAFLAVVSTFRGSTHDKTCKFFWANAFHTIFEVTPQAFVPRENFHNPLDAEAGPPQLGLSISSGLVQKHQNLCCSSIGYSSSSQRTFPDNVMPRFGF
jgi:hypothetical protein